MKAVRLVEHQKPLELTTLPDPSPEPHDAIVQVTASGICRTDWHMWMGDWTWAGVHIKLPLVLGHEIGGVIVAVGREVKTVKVGDRVTIPFHEADGTCPMCQQGHQNLCDNLQTPGQTHDGGFAEFVRVLNADLNCIVIPDEVDDLSAATLGCRYQTAYHAVTMQAQVRPGEWVAVFGCGGVGLSAIQVAKALDARVIAVDVDDTKLEKARSEGAEMTLKGSGDNISKAIKDATDGGAHVSVDALGQSSTVYDGIMSLRKRGRHVQLGLTSQEDKGKVIVPIDVIVGTELSVIGNNGNAHHHYPVLLSLVASGKLHPKTLVTKQLNLADTDQVLRSMTDYKTLGFNVITSF